MRILLLGGARSGKSAMAEQLADSASGPVTYIATAEVADASMARRVSVHQQRRPPSWTTLESGLELPQLLELTKGTALVDSLGSWLVRHEAFETPIDELCEALLSRDGLSIVVSEEVGLGVHPSTRVGSEFRDALGLLNQAVAAVCDDVFLCVAGRGLPLKDAASVMRAPE
ncbi:MAG: bifunctional adenosylcobinamide kinase/adenosylcobinamide-phosphate guanylyltransferase [Acidimicrobiales bacterium]